MTHPFQLVRHVEHARAPAPSRLSLWMAAIGLLSFAASAVLFAVEMGWFG